MAKAKKDFEAAFKELQREHRALVRDLGGNEAVEKLLQKQQLNAARQWLIGEGEQLERDFQDALTKTSFGKALEGRKVILTIRNENGKTLVDLRVSGNGKHSRTLGGYRKDFPIECDGKKYGNAMELAIAKGLGEEAKQCRYGVATFLKKKGVAFKKL